MKLDAVRQLISELVARDETDLAAVSRSMGRNHAYLHQFIHQGKPKRLNEESRAALSRIFRLSPRSFQDGVKRPLEQHEDQDPGRSREYIGIPENDIRGGAGGGGTSFGTRSRTDVDGNTVSADPIKGMWYLPTAYVQHELHVPSGGGHIIEVIGDSMSPTLNAGDRVMIDVTDKNPTPPGIFALFDGYGVIVKRLERVARAEPPAIRVISDNPHHGPFELTSDEAHIIGRVVWFARRLS